MILDLNRTYLLRYTEPPHRPKVLAMGVESALFSLWKTANYKDKFHGRVLIRYIPTLVILFSVFPAFGTLLLTDQSVDIV